MYLGRKSSWLKHLDFIIIDLLVLALSYIDAVLIRLGRFDMNDEIVRVTFIYFIVSNLLVGFFFQSYKDILKRGYYEEFVKVFKHVLLVLFSVSTLLYASKLGNNQSRLIMMLTMVISLWATYLFRICWKHFLKKMNIINPKRLLIVTDSYNINNVKQDISANKYIGYLVGDIISLDEVEDEGVIVIKDHNDIVEFASKKWIDECLFCIQGNYSSIVDIIEPFVEMGITSQYELFRRQERLNNSIDHIGDYTVLTRSIKIASYRDAFLKRCLDILGGLVGCAITLVLMVTFGIAIKIKDPGPMFFSQTRIGQNGKKFKIYKFRSMYMDAEERKKELLKQNTYGEESLMFKLDDDPRIIKGIGHFIRDYSIDEFPQFWNVLKGDMSLVGTRPPLVDEWEKYQRHHRVRMAVKPGITGMWQVSGRNDITDFEEVIKLDRQYLDNWSIGTDCQILLKTILVVIKKEGSK